MPTVVKDFVSYASATQRHLFQLCFIVYSLLYFLDDNDDDDDDDDKVTLAVSCINSKTRFPPLMLCLCLLRLFTKYFQIVSG